MPTVTIVPNKKCVGIEEIGDKVSLKFADGSFESDFDMVIGCDGTRSIVRSYLEQSGRMLFPFQSSDAPYSGLRIAYCVSEPDPKFELRKDPNSSSCRGSFHQWFGDSLYALCASYGGLAGPQHMLAVVYRDDTDAALGENESWGRDKSGIVSDIRSRLVSAGCVDVPEVSGILDSCDGGRVFDLGVRSRLLPLRDWSSQSGRVLLLGDSAHAMAPFLGQGANQALQDAYVLARCVGRANTIPDSDLRVLAKEYESKRKPPTALLSAKSGFLGALETLGGPFGTSFRDNFFRFTSWTGIAESVFLDGAKPNI